MSAVQYALFATGVVGMGLSVFIFSWQGFAFRIAHEKLDPDTRQETLVWQKIIGWGKERRRLEAVFNAPAHQAAPPEQTQDQT